MKRVLTSLLVLPLIGTIGCSEEAAIKKAAATFTSSYDLGTYVVLGGTEVTETKTFVDLEGTVTQIDDLELTAGIGACRVRDDGLKTEVTEVIDAQSMIRLGGQQKAWLLPGQYMTAGGSHADPAINIWGDIANGTLFLYEPNIDTLIAAQLGSLGGAGVDTYENEYLKTIPVGLFFFEEDVDSKLVQRTVVKSDTVDTNTVSNYDDTATRDRQTTMFTRFNLEGQVWQTANLVNLFQSPVNYNASIIVPDSVKVGDTWIDTNANGQATLYGAVAVEAIEVGDRTIKALHVVERGTTDRIDNEATVADWCVNYYDQVTDAQNSTVNLDSDLTDACDAPGAFPGDAGVNGENSGFINVRHIWYYKGLPVKIEEESLDITVNEFGYAVVNDGTLVGFDRGTGAADDCSLYYQSVAGVADADKAKYKPYAIYDVVKTKKTYMASEIRDDYTLVQEAKEEAEAAAAEGTEG